ncbi:olfactory receptor 11L1-like [Spea bombifrons]|uniref:olfactory receptor 11L1-like n=1 Tax=Spea bombifrons TaxID=233779 RepID=UPI0023499A04|nr:olfactory receptor 11L1-like [Spea bombifrons]
MAPNNVTTVLLLGFQNVHSFRILIFLLILVVYCVTTSGNVLIIALVSCSKNIRSPMYFLLSQLSVSDLLLSSDITPNLLHVLLNDTGTISLPGCISQFYFFGSSEISECFLLTAMSYDRYLAICKPLYYNSLMSHGFCLKLIIISWLLSFSIMLAEALKIYKLHFCGPRVINHFFCDFYPLLELSCSDVSRVKREVTLLCIPVIICPFAIIMVSYAYIVFTILSISSLPGRQKAFSTCSSHLTVVTIFYGTLIGMYVIPTRGKSLSAGKVLSMLYTVVTPFLNPIIYSLRNKDIRKAIKKTFGI